MNLKEEIEAIIRDMFRTGKVVSTDPDNVTVKVKFDDVDEFVSGDLQVLNRKTLEDKDLQMPDIGELVACLFLGTGQTSGYVLGSVYNGDNKPPANSQDKWVKQFKDGTRLEYDRAENKLNIEIKGDVVLHIEKDKNIKIEGEFNLESCKNINANAAENLNVEAQEANINCAAVNLGQSAQFGVVHETSPCPLYGVFHLNPSQTTKTAP